MRLEGHTWGDAPQLKLEIRSITHSKVAKPEKNPLDDTTEYHLFFRVAIQLDGEWFVRIDYEAKTYALLCQYVRNKNLFLFEFLSEKGNKICSFGQIISVEGPTLSKKKVKSFQIIIKTYNINEIDKLIALAEK